MIDREKVIKGVEHCFHGQECCGDIECPYYIEHLSDSCCLEECQENLKAAVIAMLKEQEAVEPILIREGRNKNYNDYVCPRCDNEVVYEQNYCSECGVMFLWEGR